MAVPGFSVSELLAAINKAKDIYDAFADEYESAPARIRELVDTSKYLHDVLLDCQSLLDQYENGYPHENSFSRKLDECEAFIEKYRALKQEHLKSINSPTFVSKIRKTALQTWQTSSFAFDEKRARNLKDGLQLEIQKLLLFILVFALRRTAPTNRTVVPSRASRPATQERLATSAPRITGAERDPPTIEYPNLSQRSKDTFDDLFVKIQIVRYSHEREMSQAIQHGREPNLAPIQQDLGSVWNSLCVRAGLTQNNGQAPPLLDSRLLEAPYQNYNNVIVNMANGSLHTPIQPGVSSQLTPLSPVFSSTNNPRFSQPDVSTIIPQKSTTRASHHSPASAGRRDTIPFMDIGDPALPLNTATIDLPMAGTSQLRTVSLRDWELQERGHERLLIWLGEIDKEILEHHIPPDIFPRTLHSSHTEELMHVNFHEPQRLVFCNETGVLFDRKYGADYVFSSKERRKAFQGDVRGKNLVETFDVNVVWSDRRPKKFGEATFQILKIWQDRYRPYRHSISFFASSTAKRDLDFPILGFQPCFTEHPKEYTVEISSMSYKDGSVEGGKERRRSSIFRKKSTSSEYNIPGSNAGINTLSQSPPSDRTSVGSLTASSSTYDEIPSSGALCDQLKKLKIQFTSRTGFEDFSKLFKEAYQADKGMAQDPASPSAYAGNFFKLEGSSTPSTELSSTYASPKLAAGTLDSRSSPKLLPPITPSQSWGSSFEFLTNYK